jgi:hypothetical protein
MRLKAIASLKEIVVNVQGYGEEDLSDNLMKKMRDYGWTVKVTKLEIPKKCDEGRFGFDNEEDFNAYMNDKLLREQEEEEEWWREEYYCRRRDPRTIRTTTEQIHRFLMKMGRLHWTQCWQPNLRSLFTLFVAH